MGRHAETHKGLCSDETSSTIKKNGRSLYFSFYGFSEESDGDSRVAQVNDFLAGKATKGKAPQLRVSLNYVTWADMAAMTDRVVIDGRVFSPKMTFAEFKALYPKSAMNGASEPDGIMGYMVNVGVPLDPDKFVFFGFRDGKLVRLSYGYSEEGC